MGFENWEQSGTYKWRFNFGNVDSYGDIILPGAFNVRPNFNKGNIDKCFDIQDAVIISEPDTDSFEYWQHQYERYFALKRSLEMLGELNSVEAKNIITNINYLHTKLQKYELNKSK